MIPEGKESEYFSLFSFTDRGSSWIGPAIVSAVIQNTGTIRQAFTYPLVALVVPSILLYFLIDFGKAEREAKAHAKKYHTAKLASRGGLSVVVKDELMDLDADKPVFAQTPTPTPDGGSGTPLATSVVSPAVINEEPVAAPAAAAV
jgi:hypothetical protein